MATRGFSNSTWRAGVTVLAGLLWLLSAAGTGAFDFGQDEQVAAAVEGQPIGTKGELYLAINAGPVVGKTLRLYAEPSHTPLLYAASLAFSESEEGKAWKEGWEKSPEAYFEVADLATAEVEARVKPPEADTRVQVWILGAWPDGKEEDRLASDVEVGAGKAFSFATAAKADESDALLLTHYCSDKEYGDVTLECPGAKFVCSPAPKCAE